MNDRCSWREIIPQISGAAKLRRNLDEISILATEPFTLLTKEHDAKRDVAQSLLYAYKRAAMGPSDQDRNMLSDSLCHANRMLMTLALLTQPAPYPSPA
jgi:hypothetical protein